MTREGPSVLGRHHSPGSSQAAHPVGMGGRGVEAGGGGGERRPRLRNRTLKGEEEGAVWPEGGLGWGPRICISCGNLLLGWGQHFLI